MTVRARLALTILLTSLATAAALVFTVASAFQRFEHERTWVRADGFIARVVATHPDLLDLHAGDPEGFTGFLGNLLLFEPGSRLYLLASDGTVLASSGDMPLAPGFQVSLAPVREAVALAGDRARAAYVMGDDPESMREGTVIAARPLRAAVIRPDAGVAGYLYLVTPRPALPRGRLAMLGSSVAGPALLGIAALVLAGALIAIWIIGTVTRPLRELSDAVDAAARDGFQQVDPVDPAPAPGPGADEFVRLRSGFHAMLARLRAQWDQLKRLDQFRREGVSNLSHDLRSPLTATNACLETMESRWAADSARESDRALLQVALRNTRNAARLVRSLGDLALLDEPSYRLQLARMDLGEVLDGIVTRFAERAAQQGVALRCPHDPTAPEPAARVDIELMERAIANLVDNALKFTPAGGCITLSARADAEQVCVSVQDTGAGIAAEELAHLFDRFYQSRRHTAPATGDGGKGLGLAIVKRIAELHEGRLALTSEPGQGTRASLCLPAAPGLHPS